MCALAVMLMTTMMGAVCLVEQVPVVNRYIDFPMLDLLVPAVSPLAGRNASALGDRFVSGIHVQTGSVEALNINIVNRTMVNFTFAPQPSQGYYNFTMTNMDRGWLFLGDYVFYTDNCPVDGMYGLDGVCTPCPAGGICPGGPRIRAMAVRQLAVILLCYLQSFAASFPSSVQDAALVFCLCQSLVCLSLSLVFLPFLLCDNC